MLPAWGPLTISLYCNVGLGAVCAVPARPTPCLAHRAWYSLSSLWLNGQRPGWVSRLTGTRVERQLQRKTFKGCAAGQLRTPARTEHSRAVTRTLRNAGCSRPARLCTKARSLGLQRLRVKGSEGPGPFPTDRGR